MNLVTEATSGSLRPLATVEAGGQGRLESRPTSPPGEVDEESPGPRGQLLPLALQDLRFLSSEG